MDDPLTSHDWDEMVGRFGAYVAESGTGDIPKKYNADPALGGWAAALRRCKSSLGEERVAQLDALGFVWSSSRGCGSKFMQSFRRLRDFREEHGHTAVGEVLGETHELARWCEAMRAADREGTLPPKRLAYLRDVGLLS